MKRLFSKQRKVYALHSFSYKHDELIKKLFFMVELREKYANLSLLCKTDFVVLLPDYLKTRWHRRRGPRKLDNKNHIEGAIACRAVCAWHYLHSFSMDASSVDGLHLPHSFLSWNSFRLENTFVFLSAFTVTLLRGSLHLLPYISSFAECPQGGNLKISI